MKRAFLLLAAAILLLSFQNVEAQSLRSMVRNKIIEDNLKAQAKRDSTRAVEEGREPDQSPNTSMNRVYMDALGLTDNVAYEKEYGFDAYMQFEINSYKKNGKLDETVRYDNYLSKDGMDYAMVFSDENGRSTILFDTKNLASLILVESDGERTGFATAIDKDILTEAAEEVEEEYTDPYAIYKTGKTKTILGYSCDEYLIEAKDEENNDLSTVHMWISEKLGKELRKEWMNNQQAFGNAFNYAAETRGMALEYEVTDEDGEKTTMTVTEIDLNKSHKISTYDYSIMSLRQKSSED
ncbi:MAG: DUF4412 domain-containing protein [Bacteroidales bacterium]